MATNLRIVERDGGGKKAAKKLRRDGFVPGIIYGANSEPAMVAIGEKELLVECYSSAFLSHVIEVKIGSNFEKFLPKSVVFHPVTNQPVHVDFQRVLKDSKVRIGVAIEFINEDKSPGLKKGGVVNIVVHKLECLCAPDSIPERLTVDMSGKEMGDSISLEEISLPQGVVAAHPERDSIIATIVGARVEKAEDSAAPGSDAAGQTASE
ncbi:MAG: 50S ribosomal protein L25/general stress protein Ctc [Holosporales bacterium]|jgi:large subunit ribosomal protein L25|nr:50S ribosomal protein L25/general stress protein Ctc [Holosporales bacterium]